MLQQIHLIIISRISMDFGILTSSFGFSSNLKELRGLASLFGTNIPLQMNIGDLKYFEKLKLDLKCWLTLPKSVELWMFNH
jgi:hypothetical protein